MRSIQAAARLARPGTQILIEGGTYYERVQTELPGEPGKEISFRSSNGVATIDGSRVSWPRKSVNYGIFELNHAYTRATGLKVVNSACSGIILRGDHVAVEGCEVARIQNHGISNSTDLKPDRGNRVIRDITIRDCRVHDVVLSRFGQGISLAADGFTVAGNDVSGVHDIGIDIWTGARNGQVVGNTVHDNPGDGPSGTGIYVDGAAYIRIHRNRVFRNKEGIVVSSEEKYYETHDIWVYNNLIYDNERLGAGLWDDTPERPGAQEVVFAHNTLSGNRMAFYLAGRKNRAIIMNNLAAGREAIVDKSEASTYQIRDNLWPGSPAGFVSGRDGDFRLSTRSPARDRGALMQPFRDDSGHTFAIETDFAGNPRIAGNRPDLGAFEIQ